MRNVCHSTCAAWAYWHLAGCSHHPHHRTCGFCSLSRFRNSRRVPGVECVCFFHTGGKSQHDWSRAKSTWTPVKSNNWRGFIVTRLRKWCFSYKKNWCYLKKKYLWFYLVTPRPIIIGIGIGIGIVYNRCQICKCFLNISSFFTTPTSGSVVCATGESGEDAPTPFKH